MTWKIREIEIDNPVVLAPMAGVCNAAFRTIVKEMGTGLIIGACLGLLAFGIIMLVLSLIPSLEALAFKTAFSVGVSLLVSMTSSAVVGSAIPLILTKIKVDPAVASGPFITTLNDIIAIVIYYSLATILFLGI